jgi:hypothetical protein
MLAGTAYTLIPKATLPEPEPERSIFGLPPIAIIVIGLVVVFGVFGLIGSKISKLAGTAREKQLDKRIADSGHSEEELRRQALSDPAWFAPVQELVKEQILGLAEVDFPRSKTHETITAVFNTVGSLVGVKLVDKDYGSYLVATKSSLHYTLFENGTLREHKAWERRALTRCDLREEYTTSERKALLGTTPLEYAHILALETEGRLVEFPVGTMITRSPRQRGFLNALPQDVEGRLHALRKAFLSAFK